MKTHSAFSCICFLLLTLFTTSLYAQGVAIPYEVTDIFRNKKFRETWITQITVNELDVLKVEKMLRSPFHISSKEESTSTHFWWQRKINTYGGGNNYEEFLARPPHSLRPGETTFGYVLVRKENENKILESWPVFVTVEQFRKLIKVIFTLNISSNRIMRISRYYSHGNYFVPWMEETRVYKEGVDPSSVSPLTFSDKNLETYILTTKN